jgi:DNA-directed RNA polymerase specialized sigma24 family protein
LSLKDVICLCAGASDDEAWEEFVSRVARPISLTIRHTASLWGDHSRYLVEDLIQATYLKLWEGGLRLLRDFAIDRPEAILGYLKKIAANATHDYFKHGRSQTSGGNNCIFPRARSILRPAERTMEAKKQLPLECFCRKSTNC